MKRRVTLVAVGAGGTSAVGSRIGAFARGLGRRGWDVTVIDAAAPSVSLADRMLSRTPTVLRSMLERAGMEGDVRLAAGWRVGHALRAVTTDVVIVSVPPFSLLGATAVMLDPGCCSSWTIATFGARATTLHHSPERPGRSSGMRYGAPPQSSTQADP